MLNVSAANNNRAGSFIGYSLSPVRTFSKEILDLPLNGLAASTLAKFFAKGSKKLKIYSIFNLERSVGEKHED